ncbi:RICIN domain-containing protein [Amycolatopsis anabasis]|uniref:RICIN domain-containing protein n=1 Tax=Amycolatopsis anabasis TaxID=1840409 RepID=UPI00131C5B69|nr:RICIN domain-containing protein [Amycolatopsis anabasis]
MKLVRTAAAAAAVTATVILSGTAPATALEGADLRLRDIETRCLAVIGSDNGAPVSTQGCNGNINQIWAGGATIDGDIRSAWNGRCVTAVQRDKPYRVLEAFDCTGAADQHWTWDKHPTAREALCLKFEPNTCLWWRHDRGPYVADLTVGEGFWRWYFH